MLPNPVIFGHTIDWFTFFPKIAVLFTIVFGRWYYINRAQFRLPISQWISIIMVLFVVMLGFGRIVGFIEQYLRYGYFPEVAFIFRGISQGGFRWCGALLGILLIIPLIPIRFLKKINFYLVLDMLALCFCVFTIFIKQACQFSGDGCYGTYTTLPWGMYYPYGVAPNIIPVHPTPIYDSLFHLGLLIYLIIWDRNGKKQAGQTAYRYFIAVSVFYICLEMIRINPAIAWGISLPQLVYLLVLVTTILIFKKYYFI